MSAATDQQLQQRLDAMLGVMRNNWLWPSPETAFARYVFSAVGESVPVPNDDDGTWPDPNRLDEAPILAAAGYLLGDRPQAVRPDQHQAWADGMERLRERNAFSTMHISFAYRPLEVLGIALGAAACAAVQRPQIDWLRGVIARLRGEQISNEPWSDLLYGIAAATLGETWRNRLFFDLGATGIDVLALLRWLVRIETNTSKAMFSGRDRVDAELLRRFKDLQTPRDVARAALIFHSLSQAAGDRRLSKQTSSRDQQIGVRRQVLELEVSPGTMANMPSGVNMNLTLVNGDQNMGDKISVNGNVMGSALGTGASTIVGDIMAYQSMVDNSTRLTQDLKAKLKEAREAVEKSALGECDKQDVLDDLGKLTEEMEKRIPEAGRVARFFNRIKEIAPSVASILSSTAIMAKVIGSATGHATSSP
jgi:hypothetical protein